MDDFPLALVLGRVAEELHVPPFELFRHLGWEQIVVELPQLLSDFLQPYK